MSLFLEIVLQIILEPIVYAYVDFVQTLMPDKKLKSWQRNLLMCLCVLVIFISFMLILVGIFFCLDEEPFKTAGIIMLITGVAIMVIQCLLALVVCILKRLGVATNNGETLSSATDIDNTTDNASEDYIMERCESDEPKPVVRYIDAYEFSQNNEG